MSVFRGVRLRRLVAVGVAGVVWFGVVPVAGAQSERKPIKVAFIGDLSGNPSFAVVGQSVLSGINTALKQINDGGGVAGRKFQLDVYDTQSNATAGAAIVRQALASNPDVITGWLVSTTLAASMPAFNTARKPMVLSMGLFDGVDKVPFLNTVYVEPAAGIKAMALGAKQLLGGSFKGKKVVLEGIAPSVSIDAKINGIKAAVKKDGGTVSRILRDPASITSWSSQAANVASVNPDLMTMTNVDGGAVTIMKAMAVAGVNVPVLADSTSNSDGTFAAINSKNFYALRDLQPPETGGKLFNAILDAKASTKRAQGSPFFARGYGALHVMAQTLKKCGFPCPTDKFVTSIKALGDITPPLNPFFGPLNFTKSTSGISNAQLFSYDPATKKPVAAGPVIQL